jgi:ribosomal protein S18 acetylase RimI-like enzyme
MGITIALAGPDDIPILIRLMQEYYAHDHIAFDEAASLSALRDLLAQQDLGRVWLVHLNGSPIGYAVLTFGYSLEFHGRDAFIDELYIQEPYRGRGIGTQTLRFVESAARSLGIRAIHLEVERDNEQAQRFYESVGFTARDRFFLMSKPL